MSSFPQLITLLCIDHNAKHTKSEDQKNFKPCTLSEYTLFKPASVIHAVGSTAKCRRPL